MRTRIHKYLKKGKEFRQIPHKRENMISKLEKAAFVISILTVIAFVILNSVKSILIVLAISIPLFFILRKSINSYFDKRERDFALSEKKRRYCKLIIERWWRIQSRKFTHMNPREAQQRIKQVQDVHETAGLNFTL